MHMDDESSRHQAQIDLALEQAAAAKARRAQHLVDASTAPIGGERVPAMVPQGIEIPGYELSEELQRGGQGVVFRAVQTRTGRNVAIKLMRDGPCASAADRARFEREIRVLARLRHPYIVPIYDSGEAAGWQYFVMDYIAGLPLDEFARSRSLSPRQMLILFVRICDALDAAHLRGVIHRDLKPANIRVDENGVPHVLDFGLAKQPEGDPDEPQHTLTGQFVGSLPWASPEQVSGEPGSVDMRSDVYSLGVMLYRLLTGQHPYSLDGSVRAVIERISVVPPRRPRSLRREIDDEIDTLVLKCLAKEPERRYQSAGELARDLRNYLTGRAIDAKRDSGWYMLRKQLRRHRLALLGAGAFVGLLVLSSLVAWSLYATAERARRAERERLWESYVAQARAGRSSERVGRRFDSLQAVRAAAEIRTAAELRDEAVACLALPDLERTHYVAGALEAGLDGLIKQDRFVCVPEPGVAEVRRLDDERVLARLELPNGQVVRQYFSPDGGCLALKYVFPRDSALCFWDVTGGQLVARLNGPLGGSFGEGQFDPRGRWFAMIEADGRVSLVDHRSGRVLQPIDPGFRVDEVAIDPGGTRLALADVVRPRAAIWNIENALIEQELPSDARVYALGWSPDGRWLAVGGSDQKVCLWNVLDGSPRRELLGHRAPVVAVEFDRSGKRLASYGWDSQVRVWNVEQGEAFASPFVGVALAGFGEQLALAEVGGLSLWRFADVNIVRPLVAERLVTREALFADDGSAVLTSGESGVILLPTDGSGRRRQLHPRDARSIAITPDGRNAFATIPQGLAHWRLAWDGFPPRVESRTIVPGTAGATGVDVSPDGTLLVVCNDESVKLMSVENHELLSEVACGWGTIDPDLSADGRHVFVGNWRGIDYQGSLIDLEDRRIVRCFAGDHAVGTFDPSGRTLAVCTRGEAEFWDVASDERLARLPRAPGQLAIQVAFSPDGRLAAWARSNYEVQLIDASSRAVILRIPNPELRMVSRLSFSADGERLMITSASAVTQIWELGAIRRELSALKLDW